MREREGENDDTINYIRKNDEKHKKNEVIMRWKKSSCMNIINQITMIGRLFGNDEKKNCMFERYRYFERKGKRLKFSFLILIT